MEVRAIVELVVGGHNDSAVHVSVSADYPGHSAQLVGQEEEADRREDSFSCAFDGGGAIYHRNTGTLLVVNRAAKLVWDMRAKGYGQEQIAFAFSQCFDVSEEHALQDVTRILSLVKDSTASNDGAKTDNQAGEVDARLSALPVHRPVLLEDCGVFRFGDSKIRVLSNVAAVDSSYFARFKHRAIDHDTEADALEVAEIESGCQVTYRGKVVREVPTTAQINPVVTQFLIGLEHPQNPLLAYCHAAAVSREGHSLLMPGGTGVGKSTLTGFLVANGFAYLGDDINAIGEETYALFPLPSCLSIKSGSWEILSQFYPQISKLPTLRRYGRSMRYIEPENNYLTIPAAAAPSAIIFPAYDASKCTRVTSLSPLQTMARLLEAETTLFAPVTPEKLAKWSRFVEQTPAYELTYADLLGALRAVEGILADRS